ncbi:MAG TPA: patatin-like phospholipase family protein, partial [Solirubrobacteraceae bacterium]
FEIGRDDFLGLLERDPRFAAGLARSLGRQLQASRGVAPEQDPLPRTIAVVALGSDSPARQEADLLVRTLARFGTIDSLQEASSDSHDDAALARELDHRERRHDRVLLVAQASDSASWRAFCIREADRVLALASARAPVPTGSLQVELAGCDLVRWGASGAVPSAPWVDALEPGAVYTLAAHAGMDRAIAVIARRLAGRSVGLVFSGGGARGAAHIGVVEVLAAAGVVVDRVAGASIGALAAAAFAAGMSAADMADAWHRNMIVTKPLNDYTVPAVALIRGAKFRAGLRDEFGSMQIEDLPHECFCVSADIHTRELYVHRRGPLVDAIYASMAIPGLLPPANVDGRILVDGGILNNLPVETLARRGEGPVVASVLTDQGFRHRHTTRAAEVGRQARLRSALRTAVTGVEGPVPRLRDTLMRVLTLASVDATRAARAQADVVITPDTRGIGMLEFTAIDRAVTAGREAALTALAQPDASERLLLD